MTKTKRNAMILGAFAVLAAVAWAIPGGIKILWKSLFGSQQEKAAIKASTDALGRTLDATSQNPPRG